MDEGAGREQEEAEIPDLSLEAEDELDLEGEMEDDWENEPTAEEAAAAAAAGATAAGAVAPPHPDELPKLAPEEVKRRLGMSQEEAELWERGAEAMFEDGKFPEDIRSELKEKFASGEGILDSFASVGGGGEQTKWVVIPVNDTWSVKVSQVPGATAKFVDMMRTATEATADVMEDFHDGSTIWPSSVVLSRWLVIQPPVVELQGKSVVEIGAGLGLPSIVAARLGASRVLVQDRMEEPLRQVLETGVEENVIEHVTTLRCDWKDLPTRVLSAKEEILQRFAQADVFLGADILFSEGAAEDVADALAQLLQTTEQVALIMDPYKRRQRRPFMKRCRSNGLEVKDSEIITWEPETHDRLETEEGWVHNLLTIRRMS